jgi:hypothetical protein
MSRLYLAFALLWYATGSFGQVKIKDLIKFGDEQFSKGDYYYATIRPGHFFRLNFH